MKNNKKTTFQDFCNWVLEQGGDYKSGIAADDSGRMYSFVICFPRKGANGIVCMFEGMKLEDHMSQRMILSAKRKLQLF